MATADVKARISLDSMAFQAGLNRCMEGMGKLRAITIAVGAQIASFGMRAAGSFGSMAASGVKSAVDLGSELLELREQTGLLASESEKLRVVFKAAGIGEDAVGAIVNKMQAYIATHKELRGLAPEKQFLAVVRAIKGIASLEDRAKAAKDMFGRGGGQILRIQAEDFKDASGFIASAGRILNENAADFDRSSDMLNRAGDKIRYFWVGFTSRINSSVLPLLEALDKVDSAAIGERVGEGFKLAAFTFAGIISGGNLGQAVHLSVEYGLLKAAETFTSVLENNLSNVLGVAGELVKNNMLVTSKGTMTLLEKVRKIAENRLFKVWFPEEYAQEGKENGGNRTPTNGLRNRKGTSDEAKERTKSDEVKDELFKLFEANRKAAELLYEKLKEQYGAKKSTFKDWGPYGPSQDPFAKGPQLAGFQMAGRGAITRGGFTGAASAPGAIAKLQLLELKTISGLLGKIAGGNSGNWTRLDNY